MPGGVRPGFESQEPIKVKITDRKGRDEKRRMRLPGRPDAADAIREGEGGVR